MQADRKHTAEQHDMEFLHMLQMSQWQYRSPYTESGTSSCARTNQPEAAFQLMGEESLLVTHGYLVKGEVAHVRTVGTISGFRSRLVVECKRTTPGDAGCHGASLHWASKVMLQNVFYFNKDLH